MELGGYCCSPFSIKNIFISVLKSFKEVLKKKKDELKFENNKNYTFYFSFEILERSSLKQKKDELNIFISYGDMGVCRELSRVVGSRCNIQYLGNT